MIWKILPLISLFVFFFLALYTFSAPMQPKDLTPCEFYKPLLEYEKDFFLLNQADSQVDELSTYEVNGHSETKNSSDKDASNLPELFNLVHPKDSTKNLSIFGNKTYATYELDGKKYETTMKYDEPQCACVKGNVKKLGQITKFAQTIIDSTCSVENCLQNYYQKNIHSSKNGTFHRLSALLSQFSISPKVFVPLDQSRLNQKDDHPFEDLDKYWAKKYNSLFGEVKTTQENFEHDAHTRLLNGLECEFKQVKDLADEFHLHLNKTMHEAFDEV